MTQRWTQDPEELKAMEDLRVLVAGWVESLYAVPEARYANPAGGHQADV